MSATARTQTSTGCRPDGRGTTGAAFDRTDLRRAAILVECDVVVLMKPEIRRILRSLCHRQGFVMCAIIRNERLLFLRRGPEKSFALVWLDGEPTVEFCAAALLDV